jgi:DNA polymerase III alpha subunit
MTYDKFGNAIYQEKDLINLLYANQEEFITQVLVEETSGVSQFELNSNLILNKINQSLYDLDIEDFDKICQNDWLIPEDYKNMDIEGFLVHQCPKENYQRLIDELQEFRARNMLPLLRTLKYVVDTLRNHNIIWGVGRGSSVASYVLYILGVHRIDSVKYNLNWREFLR